MIYLDGQLSQFVSVQSIHCSSFQQIFLLGLGNVFCIPRRLNICALNSECLSIGDTFFKWEPVYQFSMWIVKKKSYWRWNLRLKYLLLKRICSRVSKVLTTLSLIKVQFMFTMSNLHLRYIKTAKTLHQHMFLS